MHNTHTATPLLQAAALGKATSRHTPTWDHAGYLFGLVRTDQLRNTLSKAITVLNVRGLDFDAVAFRGQSGSLIGPPLALAMDKTMLMVRKECPANPKFCHSYRNVEGDLGAKTYIIVDDVISSGNTVRKIVEEIAKVAPNARCIGVLETDELNRYLREPFRKLKAAHSAGLE